MKKRCFSIQVWSERMSMARTMKDVNLAYQVLAARQKGSHRELRRPKNRTPIRATALVNA